MREQFLTQAEKLKLEAISHGDSPESGLAQTLLALNEGSPYGEAGKPAGLTSRQTRYQRDKFLKLRLEMFIVDITEETKPEFSEPQIQSEEQEQPPIEEVAAVSDEPAVPEEQEQLPEEEMVAVSEELAAPAEETPVEVEVESQKKKAKKKSKDSKKSKKKKKKGKSKAKGKKGKKEREESDTPKKMKRDAYEDELAKLEVELVRLQGWIKDQGLKVAVIFEGRDSAGKGGTIKRITRRLSPRVARVVALGTPTEKEKSQFYFQRYISQFPSGGEMVLFDRSWYNRAGVEKVMGFCTEGEYLDFLRLCPQFERALVDSGIILIKYWMHITDETQEDRFQQRIDDPRRRWKLSPMDLEARARWVDYSKARDVMFEYTDTDWAPWYVVNANIKRHARLNCISHLLSKIPYKDLTPETLKLPDRQPAKGYKHPPESHYKTIPEVYPGGKS